MARKKIGEILIEKGHLDASQLSRALELKSQSDKKIGQILVSEGIITPEQVAEAFAEQTGIPLIPEDFFKKVDPSLLSDFPIGLARKFKAMPVFADTELHVAVTDTDPLLFNQLFMLYRKNVKPYICSTSKINDLINHAYSKIDSNEESLNAEEFADMNDDSDVAIPDLIDSNDEAPIIRFVNNTIAKAVKDKASDIHFESYEDEVIVRLRKDGKLYTVQRVPKAAQAGLITRIKIMSRLNISEKRLPQDGNIKVKIAGNDVDFRVSTLPSIHGESVVLRILDKRSQQLSLDESGFTKRDLERMRKIIRMKHGIFLVTGPTGSGKTTTLYSALTEINSPDVKIITEEDPVEYQLKGVNQIHINSKIGLTFASGLRSILRQDPDIIMVGEIRDRETADIAINASLTGHLVFSTLHTNDAPTAFTRLIDMGIEPFLISSTVLGILAQRLVRKLCPVCKEAYYPEPAILEELGLDPAEYANHPFYKAVGCDECAHTGYSGRTGIFELVIMDDELRRAVVNRLDASDIRKIASANGMLNLREDGAMKAIKGITSPDEVLLRTQEDN
ncbi:MAG TPA: ATPase, T2SS/T4P/T4SS family [bacterium]|nr:Flp pilus assembly complex ATPase component TadA [bacterium]HPM45720.1 ATPase, T2SS/T4P/T4SS family [bacterium]HPV20874.1 ATPase, T2SS/T4P/T4SS family [bacterium]HQM83520.1 ATPase, T2SS/T4P/T4SS family [bacterium]HRQ69460.1 ATPase, T2SS/T4P/T4SS family [bacterium]